MKKKIIFCFLILFFAVFSAYSQQKFALVIGNGNYTSITKLNNPGNDANDIKTTLESLGWTVDILRDANQEQIDGAVVKLKSRLSASANSYGFVFYAGHAVQSDGVNYLIPIDANFQSASALKSRAVSVQMLLDDLDDAGNELNIVVLDACRDNPFSWSRGGSRGLVVVEKQPANSIIAFATSAGSVAADGEGKNGLYTTHLLKNLKTTGISVQELFRKTGEDVENASGKRQRPAVYSSYNGVAYLGSKPQQNPNPTPGPAPTPAVSLYDQLINAKGTAAITVTQDATLPSSVTISNASSVTLRGGKAEITVSGTGYLIIDKGVTLVLENITVGIPVLVNKGGMLIMNNASAVTATGSVGIVVEGTFTMNEGSVSNNINGGVFVHGGTFTMNNGRIAGNNYGGVVIYGGTFTMKNGKIENNKIDYGGGGVDINANGSFFMQGGSISSNTGYHGGVHVAMKSIFKMTGGVIYGRNGGSNANICTAFSMGLAVYNDNGKNSKEIFYYETIYQYE